MQWVAGGDEEGEAVWGSSGLRGSSEALISSQDDVGVGDDDDSSEDSDFGRPRKKSKRGAGKQKKAGGSAGKKGGGGGGGGKGSTKKNKKKKKRSSSDEDSEISDGALVERRGTRVSQRQTKPRRPLYEGSSGEGEFDGDEWFV